MSRRKKLPTEPFTAAIRKQHHDGTGLTEHDGRRLRVFGALPGEAIRARYRFGRPFRGQAEVVDILQPAPQRVAPRCPHFGQCGGCALQHMDYVAQLEFKQGKVLGLLTDQGLAPEQVLPPLTAGPWYYRRKARLSVRDVPAKGRVLVGFREQDKRFVVDMRECHTLEKRVAGRLESLSRLLGTMDARRTIPQIEVSCGDEDCALIFRHLEPLSGDDADRLLAFEADTGMAVWLQSKGPDTVCRLGAGRHELSYRLPEQDVTIAFLPQDFTQVNGGLNRLMVGQALNLLAPGPEHRVLELFCGLGNFTLPLARRARFVAGLEGDAGLLRRARDNAERNGLRNVDFRQADLYAGNPAADWPQGGFDRVLLDPPRSGAAEVLAPVADSGASKLLYVSCNPETLARDAGMLVARFGFRLLAAGAMDMFPQTAHVEAMALFVREP